MNWVRAASCTLVACAASLVSATAEAQRGAPASAAVAPTTAALVTVMRVAALPREGALVAVIRRAGMNPADVILVTDRATARELAQAIRAFRQLRARVGDSFPGEVRTFVETVPDRVSFSSEELAAASRAISALATASETSIERIGTGRFTTTTITPR